MAQINLSHVLPKVIAAVVLYAAMGTAGIEGRPEVTLRRAEAQAATSPSTTMVESRPRSLEERLSEVVNVKDFGAVGDGRADDTAAIQAAIDSAARTAKPVMFPAGVYAVLNVRHGPTPWVGVPRRSTLVALPGGDAGYLVASPNWLTPGNKHASAPFGVYAVDINAKGLRKYGLVLRTYMTKIENCRISGAVDTDLLFTSDARDGTLLGSTMVNNEVKGCWLGVDGKTAQYNLRTIDTNAKATDYTITDNYFSGASVENMKVEVSAGWTIAGNHFYGAPRSFRIGRPDVGTRITNNYAEGEGYFGSTLWQERAAVLGPANFFRRHVWAKFGVGDVIVSTGNQYDVGAELRHTSTEAKKTLISQGDVFRAAQPFAHYAGDARDDASGGRFVIQGALISPIGRIISATFDGPRSTSPDVMHRPSGWNSSQHAALGSEARSGSGGVLPRHMKHASSVVEGTATATSEVRLPPLGPDNVYRVEVVIGTRESYDGVTRTRYYGLHMLARKPDGTHHFTSVVETIRAADFSVKPTLSARKFGDDLVITVTAAQSTAHADAFGGMSLTVF